MQPLCTYQPHAAGRRFSLSLFLLIFLCSSAALATRKTDIVYLNNGDKITGEYKEMRQGELEFSTSDIGTIYIKWEAIARIESDKWLQIETSDGERFFGTLPPAEDVPDRILAVQTLKDEKLEISMNDVVRVEQIRRDASFWDRVKAYGKVGANYTKASEVFQGNFSLDGSYRTERYLASASVSSNITRNGGGEDSRRANLGGSLIWFQPDRWFYAGQLNAEQNDELGIDLRLTASAGAGRYLVQTQKTEFYALAGLALNREFTTTDDMGEDSNNTNVEGVLGVNWTFFKLYTPKSRINFSATVFPGITESDRVRGNATINLRQEILITDLFWDLDLYYDYDSEPPAGANATDDYGVITSLGYEF